MARISGVIAAIVLAVLLGMTIQGARQPDDLVVPTGGVTNRGPQDSVPAGAQAQDALAARTRLQMWRGESGPAPGERADIAIAGRPLDGTTDAQPRELVQTWLGQRDENWGLLRQRAFLAGTVNLPDPTAAVLQQPQGRDWRRLHNEEIYFGGGIVIFGAAFLLALYLALRGRIRTKAEMSGQTVQRFNTVERWNHWVTAISFILLALTGLLLLYGQSFLKPVLGAPAYRDWATVGVYTHVIAAIPFVLGVILMVILWLRDNWVTPVDLRWLARAGGLFGGGEPHAHKFNAGQKAIFWAVLLSMIVLLGTGLSLIFPFSWLGYDGMQWAQLVHAAVALIMVAIMLGHIYLGTVGMQGAFDAMWGGKVDRTWAREHHDLWYERIEGGSGAR